MKLLLANTLAIMFQSSTVLIFCVDNVMTKICVCRRPAVWRTGEVHRSQSLQQEEGGDVHHHRRALQLRCRVSSCEVIRKKQVFCQ